jgi:hypothetical protein
MPHRHPPLGCCPPTGVSPDSAELVSELLGGLEAILGPFRVTNVRTLSRCNVTTSRKRAAHRARLRTPPQAEGATPSQERQRSNALHVDRVPER